MADSSRKEGKGEEERKEEGRKVGERREGGRGRKGGEGGGGPDRRASIAKVGGPFDIEWDEATF